MEGHTLVEIVLRGLHDLQISTLELVVEGHGRNLTGNYRQTAGLLRLILVVIHLGHGVNAGHQVVDLNLALGVGLDGLIDAVTGDGKGEVIHLAVLRGFDDLSRAVGHLQIEERLHGVTDRLCVGDNILLAASLIECSVRPGDDTTTGRANLIGGNSYAVRRSIRCCDNELVSVDAERNAILISGKAVIGKHSVVVCQGSGVTATVPFQLHALRSVRVFGHKAGDGGVTLNACFNAVIVIAKQVIQRVGGANNALNSIIATGAYIIEVLVTLTDNGFPNENLCCHSFRQRCGISRVL